MLDVDTEPAELACVALGDLLGGESLACGQATPAVFFRSFLRQKSIINLVNITVILFVYE